DIDVVLLKKGKPFIAYEVKTSSVRAKLGGQ
ncbi:hypothetical protein MetMK1DRAFT_00003090, partial [Metallosphaera yellowstonensis MK1]